jgi:hypothetical protein
MEIVNNLLEKQIGKRLDGFLLVGYHAGSRLGGNLSDNGLGKNLPELNLQFIIVGRNFHARPRQFNRSNIDTARFLARGLMLQGVYVDHLLFAHILPLLFLFDQI